MYLVQLWTGPLGDKVLLFSNFDQEKYSFTPDLADAFSSTPELLLFVLADLFKMLLSSETVLHQNCWCQDTQWLMGTLIPLPTSLFAQNCFP